MPSVPDTEPLPSSVEAEVVNALVRALRTDWRDGDTPHVHHPADAQTLAAYQAEVLTTMASCLLRLAAEVDRLRDGH